LSGYKLQGYLKRFRYSEKKNYTSSNLTGVSYDSFFLDGKIGFHLSDEKNFTSGATINFTSDTKSFSVEFQATLVNDKFIFSANTTIEKLVEDFQKEFDAYFPQRRLLSKAQSKPPASSKQSTYSFSSVPITAKDELMQLLTILQPNVTVSYEMLYERQFINASASLVSVKIAGGTSGPDFFNGDVVFNYTLVTGKNTTYFNFVVKFNANTTNKIVNVTFPDADSYRSTDENFKYKFFPTSQSKQLEVNFNNSFAGIWNTSHFQKTNISNCSTGFNLSQRLDKTPFVQNYTYPCGDKEVTFEYTMASIPVLIFHSDENTFNSTANLTFVAYFDIYSGPIRIAPEISGTNSSYKFANYKITTDEGFLTECLRVNPTLIEQVMFDWVLDFKHPKVKSAKFLQFLS